MKVTERDKSDAEREPPLGFSIDFFQVSPAYRRVFPGREACTISPLGKSRRINSNPHRSIGPTALAKPNDVELWNKPRLRVTNHPRLPRIERFPGTQNFQSWIWECLRWTKTTWSLPVWLRKKGWIWDLVISSCATLGKSHKTNFY